MSFGSDFGKNFRAQKVNVHKFSMVPHVEVPRSTMLMEHVHKTTFSAGLLIPVYVKEVLPGDTFNVSMTAYCRLATTLYPVMDQMDLESWFFFVPNRIIWQHWVNIMGEQTSSPADSISYTVPQIVSPTGGFVAFSIYDYMGIPTAGQVGGGNTISINALPLRGYNQIWNIWFRDQNLTSAAGFGATNTVTDFGDGPDPYTNYSLAGVAKRHDYFTAALPWTQKGGTAITIPLGTSATVKTSSTALYTGTQQAAQVLLATGAAPQTGQPYGTEPAGQFGQGTTSTALAGTFTGAYFSNLYADLSTATAATINQLRLSFQTQRLLERDARGGTRYQELIWNHWKVYGPDHRFQRPEYQGGGKTPVNITPVPQTSAAGLTGNTTPVGQLAGVGTALAHGHGFRGSYTEHGFIIGLIAVRNNKLYQQGLRRMWTRQTRYDYYWPVFSHLGEFGIRNDEIYCVGTPAQDTAIFGYQEAWATYRYEPSFTSGAMRSTYATPLDAWHLGTKFSALPVLNANFILDDTATNLTRTIATGPQGANEQFIADIFFKETIARCMPMYSVPGLIDHF